MSKPCGAWPRQPPTHSLPLTSRYPRTLFVFSDTPTHSILPGVGHPPKLALWRGPSGTPVWRAASLAPTLPSSGPGRLALSVLHIHTPPPARGQVDIETPRCHSYRKHFTCCDSKARLLSN
ncbi:hypothetical protein RSOLAG1IB_11837 [Rhizoctonia solani AG-1 IB]|uniref:Uncharacterized protein n=1 Tax=Thanatephorus cucumeris (strain AG1-IB / isolate 7/3/14) TaxID=1108050 RepID=A0A0B7FBW2_THACB|nr:hypothetical protein RSOLAG1IB_11837 [Rhizoctonia solani AG-1 IB]